VPGQMNGLEKRYQSELEVRLNAGEIAWFAFEPFKLRLADRTTYSPDFAVMHHNGEFEFIEIKGFWEEDARVKTKVAAEFFWMFKFIALSPKAKKHGGGWNREEF
jgi:predicted nuclease of restriction endonuclease-like RecB superfamily